MNKATTSTADMRAQQAGDGVRSAAATHYVERPPGPVHVPDVGIPADGRDHLYNVEGHLFWNGVDLTALADSSSKWLQESDEAGASIHRLGSVGIGTMKPSSELDVAGTITARGLRLQALDGVAKVARGEIVGNAVLGDMADVSGSAKPGQILVRGEAGWVASSPSEAIVLSHSDMLDLDSDDHGQYLNAERHSATTHSVPSISVADGAISASKDEVRIEAPLVIRGDVSMIGRSGILIARRGKVSADATSDDIPEGQTSRYHTPDRVAEVGDRRYLMLDGANMSSLRTGGATIPGFDADSVDGKHAAEFSPASHSHSHDDLSSIGEDDHHPRVHRIDGSEHAAPIGVADGSVLTVTSGGMIFSRVDLGSTVGNVLLSRVESGLVKPEEFESLRGVRESIQAQMDRKSEDSHAHLHSEAADLELDHHKHYLTVERADAWLDGKTADDIPPGANNHYVIPEEIVSIVDDHHLRIDGTNVPRGTIAGLDADSVDGVHAADLARVEHSHDHSTLGGVGRDDHHPEAHDIESHRVARTVPPEAVMKVRDGRPTFERISVDDLPFAAATEESVSSLSARVTDHDAAIRSKAEASHGHPHSSIDGLDADDHKQYLTIERAETFVSGLTTDELREGKDNRYFRPEAARASVAPLTPLGYEGDRLTLQIDDRHLQVVGDRLTFRNPIDEFSSVSLASLSVGDGKLSVTNNEAIVRIGEDEEPTDLVVSGKVTARAFVLSTGDGVVHAAGGSLSSGAGLGMLSDVNVETPSSEDVLSFDGLSWRNRSITDLFAAIKGDDPLTETDIKVIDRSLPPDVPSLIVGQGVSAVNPVKGTVSINSPVSKNALDVNGGIAVGRDLAGVVDVNPGTIVTSGSIGIGSGTTPRQALDTWSGLIIGGLYSESRPNVLNLSSAKDDPTSSITFHGGGSVEVSASDVSTMLRLNTRSYGSLLLAHNPSDGTLISIPQDGRLSVKIGQQEAASFGEHGMAVGVRNPRMRLDVRGHAGVSDGSANPKSWMLLRAAVPEAPPTICFPANSELQIGTLKSYDAGAVWDATASFESDGTFRVSGRIIQGITKIDLAEGRNDDVPVGAFGVVKISANAPASIGGISDGFNGAVVVLVNTGSFPISISDECVGSLRENRISAGIGTELKPKKCMTLVYDGDVERWIPSI